MVTEPDHTSETNLSDENPKTTSADDDGVLENPTDAEKGQHKALKKPDKILPCPRCDSMETKFCYYNNYNVNQPRHFCKSCQRYWTAGGAMRNVPVGAGRRKNKNSWSHCRHITISDSLQATRIDGPIGFHLPASFEPNSSVLDKSDHGDMPPCKNGGDNPIGSSVIAKNSITYGGKIGAHNINAFQSSLQGIPTAPWAIPWNSTVALPAIYPIPVFPAAYCGLPNAWSFPWLSIPSPTANQNSTSYSPLGKHSRNGELLNPSCSEHEQQHTNTKSKSSENSIVVPKALRIDDPEEAAKSSIWETLGIKYDSTTREGLFKALQPKGNEKKLAAASPSLVLQANPAALSRSINFREGA